MVSLPRRKTRSRITKNKNSVRSRGSIRKATFQDSSPKLRQSNLTIEVAQAPKSSIHSQKSNCAISPGTNGNDRMEISLPIFREVDPTGTSRSLEIDQLVKRHERLEAEEKMLIRQDRIWQNEQKRNARLLKTPKQSEDVPTLKIVVHRKSR